MKCASPVRLFASAVAVSLGYYVGVAQAQVEVIDPNPTQPRDVGGRLTYRGFPESGFRLGRTSGRDENPAETLLKSIEGTNYGRATGHSLFSRNVAPRPSNNVTQRRVSRYNPAGTMYLPQRGAYEGRVYQQSRNDDRAARGQRSDVKKPSPRRPAATQRDMERAVRSQKSSDNNAPRKSDK